MKKLIALLGAVTLTASSASLVVSCGNSSVPAYDNFSKLADATRPTLNEDGEMQKNGSTLVYYIGAQDNLSSLSFEYALKEATKVGKDASLDEAFAKLNEANASDDNTFGGNFKNIGNVFETNDAYGQDGNLAQTNVTYNKKQNLWYFESQTELFTFSQQATSTKIEMHGTTVETVGDLWTDKATKKILNDWIKPSVARMVYSASDNTSWDKTKDKEKIKKVNEEINSRVEAIKNSKGPLFLIIRNGEFVGFLQGYEAYQDLWKSGDNTTIAKGKYKPDDLIQTFNESIKNVVNTKDIMTNTYSPTSESYDYDLSKNSKSNWNWKNWDNWVVRDSKSSESESGSETFSYNLNKY
ncbi:hypothetical protein CG007_02010 [Mesoplasma entomophilum]|uniref:lipoprotein n=1 Tax=Mesoplasma entomophilum TaxID=2149 RepID=UPI000D03093A|nr:lipoprotein [Mesoplasma entomophilum]AVN60390.1 hypothetical protein CG007_02010 [Mesoplasma entomophilum]